MGRSLLKTQENRKLYSMLLLSTTLCIAATLLVSSYIYYANYVRIGLNQVYQSDLGSLAQTSREVVGMTQSAQSLSFQMYRNTTISKLMFYETPSIYDMTAASSELAGYLSSMPFIESIYVYNAKSGLMYIASNHGQNGTFAKSELADTGIVEVLDRFQEYKPFTPIPRRYSMQSGDPKMMGVYTYLCYEAIGTGTQMDSAVIVNISASWINKDLGQGGPDAAGTSYILDDRGQLLTGDGLLAGVPSDQAPALLAMLESDVRSRESGYFVKELNGTKSLVSFTSPDPLGWQYVRITPYRHITGKISGIRTTSIGIAAAILAAGLLISWLLSRFLYRPFHAMASKVSTLESEKRNSLYPLKQGLLRSLVQGTHPLKTEAHLGKLQEAGITIDFRREYRLVLLRIDGFQEFREMRGDDLTVYQFAVMNIASEIIAPAFRTETVDLGESGVLLLLGAPEGGEPPHASVLEALLAEVQRSLLDYLKLSVSLTYSAASADPSELPACYRQVKEAALHRFFRGPGSLIASEDTLQRQAPDYLFPVDKERRMTDALMAGKTDEAKSLLGEMLLETAAHPFQALQLAASRLTATVGTIVTALRKNGNVELERGLEAYVPSLDCFETLQELLEAFSAFFDELRSKQAEKRSMKQEDLIRKVNDMIGREYADPNLCLNKIADSLDLSSIHLSRVYKQQTLAAIVDVINTTRMEHAKRLLLETDLPVAEIAERIGYTSSSYLYRMFKKNFGVTPTDFRKAQLQASQT
ncbi:MULTISPECIES: AraC family transcriptional regulator [Paenibacillus]|uniref:AraC family transcriptional regulator n=1 Tax=Paenibacillus TaxID=44249 RepID=UPI0022B90D10|nr:AraC family transcriptional regulator [Paenibacillus caseinilyticus]MCZ8523423.1 AraC family transcriptional regulator [Paenibacillus caseinilyticus]